jgi:hypothetical protein
MSIALPRPPAVGLAIILAASFAMTSPVWSQGDVFSSSDGQSGPCDNVCNAKDMGTPACQSAKQECLVRQNQPGLPPAQQGQQPTGGVCDNVCNAKDMGTQACQGARQECLLRQTSQPPSQTPRSSTPPPVAIIAGAPSNSGQFGAYKNQVDTSNSSAKNRLNQIYKGMNNQPRQQFINDMSNKLGVPVPTPGPSQSHIGMNSFASSNHASNNGSRGRPGSGATGRTKVGYSHVATKTQAHATHGGYAHVATKVPARR